MIFVTGGAYQGKKRFVTDVLGINKERVLFAAHEYIEEVLEYGGDPEKMIFSLIESGEIEAVTADEIGMGIVPADERDRKRREMTGRIMCYIAANADEVYRLVCGIPVRIK